jgi:hypothetical protein
MAMFSIEEGAMMIPKLTVRATLLIAAGFALSACTQSSLRINPDFGSAVYTDTAAQIADPDAHYEGTPAPGTAGRRVGLAQQRYDANRVIQPSSTTASSARSIGNADNGSGGGGESGMSGGSSGVSAGAGH